MNKLVEQDKKIKLFDKAPNWDALYQRHATAQFIAADPIQLVYQYDDARDREFVSFLVCLFAYGGRGKIIETMQAVLAPFGESPCEALLNTDIKTWQKALKAYYYRFNTLPDMLFILSALQQTYQQFESLEACWQKHATDKKYPNRLSQFQNAIMANSTLACPNTYGMQFLLANAAKGSAAKRLNMFLRWVVRDDAVDLGLWKNALSPADLHMPLDTHVARQARLHNITQRKSNDWKTVEDITAYFRKQNSSDPVRYDLALMGLGTT